MKRGVGSIWCLVLLIPGLLPGCWSQGSHTIVIEGYRHNSTLTSGDSVSLGTQIILVCRVVGLPYGTPFSYTWTCPNGSCEVEGYYGRKVYNEHILAVNTTSTRDGGTYTCQVTATGGQEATGSFTLRVIGSRVVHSYGRLIPHEFPITDLQQISGPDGKGRINCTDSSGTARFVVNNGNRLETGGVSQTRNGTTATLVVNMSNVDSFQNRGIFCNDINANFFYLYISNANALNTPSLTQVSVTNSTLIYDIARNNVVIGPLITGYEVIHFGVPMIGEYVNAGVGRRLTISPAVPGAQYRITAWALHGDVRRSATPAVEHATAGEASPSTPRVLSITREFHNVIELNWLPPIERNGEVHYVIYYTPEGGTEQSIDTGSNLTHYNLTGLARNRVYTNISVQAVNSAGSSIRSAAIAQYNHTPPGPDSSTGLPPTPTASSQPSQNIIIVIAVAVTTVLLLVVVVGLVVIIMVTVVRRRRSKKRVYENNNTNSAVRVQMMSNSLQSTTYYEPMSPNIGPSHPHRQPHPLAIPHINTPNTGNEISMEDCPAYQSMDMHTSGEHTYI